MKTGFAFVSLCFFHNLKIIQNEWSAFERKNAAIVFYSNM